MRAIDKMRRDREKSKSCELKPRRHKSIANKRRRSVVVASKRFGCVIQRNVIRWRSAKRPSLRPRRSDGSIYSKRIKCVEQTYVHTYLYILISAFAFKGARITNRDKETG